jgi:hypothetical protein
MYAGGDRSALCAYGFAGLLGVESAVYMCGGCLGLLDPSFGCRIQPRGHACAADTHLVSADSVLMRRLRDDGCE